MDIKCPQLDTGIPTRARRSSGYPDSPKAPYQSSNSSLIAPQVPQDHWSAVTASIFLASGLQFPFLYQADDDIFPLLKRSVITTRWAVNSYCCWKKGFHKNFSSLLTLLMNMQFSMIWYMRNQKICAGDRLISLFLVKKEEWLANIFFASDVFNRSNGCERYN